MQFSGDLVALVLISFLEAFILPFPPPDVVLVGLAIMNPSSWPLYAALSTISSMLGGVVGYHIGKMAGSISLIRDKKEGFVSLYDKYGPLAVLIGGITPLPFKVVSILSGVLDLKLREFIVMALISRGIRLFIVSAASAMYGRQFIEMLISRVDVWVVIGAAISMAWLGYRKLKS